MVDRSGPVLAIVPDGGESAGLPDKNRRQLGGHPLISYGVASGLAAKNIDRIIVSTSDQRMAQIACAYGAEAPFLRPRELATQAAPDISLLQHALDWLRDHENYTPSIVVQIQTGTPFRPHGFLDEAVALLQSDENADSVRAVAHAKPYPATMWTRGEGDYLRPLRESGRREPDNGPGPLLPEALWQTGHVDVVRTDTILKKGSLSGDAVKPIFVDTAFAAKIDQLQDLHFAEYLLGTGALDIDVPRRTAPLSLPPSLPLALPPSLPLALPLAARIRLVVLDFDGTLTDDRVWVDSAGRESVACSRSDGLGLEMLRKAGIEACVLSKEANPVVARRCEKLGIACKQGIAEKVGALREILAERKVDAGEAVYVGNDVIDLDCMRLVGFSFAPADAHPDVLQHSGYVLSRRGGRGAVREVCEILLANLKAQEE